MDENNETYENNEVTKVDYFKCLGLMFVSGVLFFLIPDDVGIIGWILFAVGTFLLVIGVFKIASIMHKPENMLASVIWFAVFVIAAVYIQICGFTYLYNTGGTAKGIIIATLALCMSLGLLIFSFDENNKKLYNVTVALSIVICALLLGFALYLNVRDGFSDASVYVGTMLLIEFLVIGEFALTSLKKIFGKKQK